eukprot:3135855-Pleurochrysis_carterae.AAC.1
MAAPSCSTSGMMINVNSFLCCKTLPLNARSCTRGSDITEQRHSRAALNLACTADERGARGFVEDAVHAREIACSALRMRLER